MHVFCLPRDILTGPSGTVNGGTYRLMVEFTLAVGGFDTSYSAGLDVQSRYELSFTYRLRWHLRGKPWLCITVWNK